MKWLKTIFFPTILILFTGFQLYAQTLLSPQHRFSYITNENGLSQNNVTTIFQDYEGFMWFGTWDGLNKYNGYEFEVFKHNPEVPNSIGNNTIRVLFENRKRQLYIGTDNGLSIFNRDSYTFQNFRKGLVPDSLNGNCIITAIYEDIDSTIWVISDLDGIHLASKKVNEQQFTLLESFPYSTEQLFEAGYGSIGEDANGNLLLGTSKSGLVIYDKQTKLFSKIKVKGKPDKSMAIMSVLSTSDGNTWIGTQQEGIFKYNPETKYLSPYFQDNQNCKIGDNMIWKLYEDSQQRIWVCTDRGGLFWWSPITKCFQSLQEESFNHPTAIYDIYESRDGVFWIGTYSQGIGLSNKRAASFRHFTHEKSNGNSLSYKVVRAIEEDSKGNLWIGTDRGGLNKYSPDKNNFKHFQVGNTKSGLTSNIVRSICVDHNDNIWMGTLLNGLNVLTENGLKIYHYQHNDEERSSIANDKINVIYQDKRRNVWLGTQDGISLIKAVENDQQFNYPKLSFVSFSHNPSQKNSLSSNSVYAFCHDSQGRLWVGTLKGLNLFLGEEKGFLNQQNNPVSLPLLHNNFVHCIEEDSKGNILAGTRHNGLFILSPDLKNVIHLTETDGLPNNSIFGIMEDQKGNYWITTANGLAKYNSTNGVIKNYHKYDGLQDNEFRLNAYEQLANGQMAIGGINGFNIFHPDSIFENEYMPPVVFTDFKVLNKSIVPGEGEILKKHINQTNSIELTYHQSSISIGYVALNYLIPSNNQYAYKLEGFDQQWNEVGERREAIYTNLPYGEYTFKVKASNNDGLWNNDGTSIQIIIAPPFWLTPIAFICYAFCLGAVFYAFWLFKLKKDQIKFERLEKEKLRELNQVKVRFFTNISHEIRTPLTLIAGPLESLDSQESLSSSQAKYYLNIMKNNVARLKELIDQLLTFRKLETGKLKVELVNTNAKVLIKHIKEAFEFLANEKSVNYILQIDLNNENIACDREKVEKVLFNLLSNAFKYVPENGCVKVKVFETAPPNGQSSPFMNIEVEDNGAGIPPEKLSKIFERFYQVEHGNYSRHKEGSGIGLALSKELAELLGGNLMVNNLEEGGVLFTFTFPIHPATTDNHSPIPKVSNDYTGSAQAISGSDTKTEKKYQILIIDDNADIRAYIENELGSHYQITQADNGLKGLEIATEKHMDLIISDVMMPVMDGVTLTKKLKEDINTSHIPTILLTAKTSDQHQIEGLTAGAEDYILKPFNATILKTKVKNLLALRENLKQQFANGMYTPDEANNLPDIDKKLIKSALTSIMENLNNPGFDGEALRRDLHISRTSFFRKMKALTSHSPNEFIKAVRIKKAAQILTSGNFTVSQVAYEVGFNEPSHFSRSFKKQFGVSPSEYQLQQRENLN